MKITMLTAEEAKIRASELPFQYIKTISDLQVGMNNGILPETELLEARFFGPDDEVRIFTGETGMQQAVLLQVEPEDETITRSYAVENQKKFGSAITVTQLLDFDEDGQIFVRASILSGWKGD